MAQRFTTTLLLMAYFASQLVVVPHAHDDSSISQPSDHNSRPHVHVSWFGQAAHSHGSGHAHHHGCDENCPSTAATDANTGHQDHDSNAVYLPCDAGISLAISSMILLDYQQINSTLSIAAISTPTTVSEVGSHEYSPDKCIPGCPLYLALRALRI